MRSRWPFSTGAKDVGTAGQERGWEVLSMEGPRARALVK